MVFLKQTEPSVAFLKASTTQHCVFPDAIWLGVVCGSADSLDCCPVFIPTLCKWVIHHVLVFLGSHFKKCHLSLPRRLHVLLETFLLLLHILEFLRIAN